MARNVLTTIVIVSIILIGTSRLSAEPTELTVLTYNTHLFEDSPLECIARCTEFWKPALGIEWADYALEDGHRREGIAARVRSSGADIVALQEVWAIGYRNWFQDALKDTYPYAYHSNSSCDANEALVGVHLGLPTCITGDALLYLPFGGPDYANRLHTEGNGLLLLSKWPLQALEFAAFPAGDCDLDWPGETECWNNKGVLTATVNVGDMPIRIGISHANFSDDKSKWSKDYIAKAITTFQLNGEPYIFALDKHDQAHIRRFEDYGRAAGGPGAGWKHIHTGTWGSDHIAVTSFELNGHPYLFGVNGHNIGHIERINDDGRGWTNMHSYDWGSDHVVVTSFQLNGHPYLFGVNSRNEGHIERIEDDGRGWTNMNYYTWGSDHVVVTSFQLNGHPYLFGVNSRNEGHIERINDDGRGWTNMNYYTWGSDHVAVTSFELNGHPYLFGLNSRDEGHIERINDDGRGWTNKVYKKWTSDYVAVNSFQMNGHPFLFGLRNCCEQEDNPCGDPMPGQAHLKRINDNAAGWENLIQFENMKMIRDETLQGYDSPAIMMGDFNVEAPKYAIMDELFRKAGAVDAYVEVHGSGMNGCTVDWYANRLHQYFVSTQSGPARIDYVYVKQSGAGTRLVPTQAAVLRDWEYSSPSAGGDMMDLSDHYPLIVTFELFDGGCSAREKGDLNCDRVIDFADLAILSSTWGSRIGDDAWDLACDISDPCDDVIDLKDVRALAQTWLSMPPVYNVTRGAAYASIQTAIANARNGDEIEVAPGTYYEAIDFIGKAIRLYSSGGPDVTTIDGTGNYHVVQCASYEGADTVIEGFTITGGNANGVSEPDNCGGGMLNERSSPTIIDCNFAGNRANANGGGMYSHVHNTLKEESPTIINCTFSNNNANEGAGMCNDWYLDTQVINCTFISNSANNGGAMYNLNHSSPTIADCEFAENFAHYNGGGIHDHNSSPVLTDCTFTRNYAGDHGGGISSIINSSPTMADCVFSGNTAAGYGGGVINSTTGDANIANCTFDDNSALSGGGMVNIGGSPTVAACLFRRNTATADGGGVHNHNSNPTLTDCNFAGNEAGEHGGGMSSIGNSSPTMADCVFSGNTAAGYGGGVINSTTGDPNIANCTFDDNSAASGGGMVNMSGSPTVTACLFRRNTATADGGGVHNHNSNPTMTNCAFTGNQAGDHGGGMSNVDNGSAAVTHCIFNGNEALGYGGGVINSGVNAALTNCTFTGNNGVSGGGGIGNVSCNPIVTNCILWDDTPDEILNVSSSPTVTYSDVKGGWSGTENIDLDPLFVAATAGNLRLSSGSPCIDKGDNSAVPPGVTTDLDGNARLIDGDDNGSADVDMGAYEYQSPASAPASAVNIETCYILASHWLDMP